MSEGEAFSTCARCSTSSNAAKVLFFCSSHVVWIVLMRSQRGCLVLLAFFSSSVAEVPFVPELMLARHVSTDVKPFRILSFVNSPFNRVLCLSMACRSACLAGAATPFLERITSCARRIARVGLSYSHLILTFGARSDLFIPFSPLSRLHSSPPHL